MEKEREREKHQCVVAIQEPSTGDLACHPGMCPSWESNQRPFASQVCAQSSELHQPRQSQNNTSLILIPWSCLKL